jgi:hypothetical protein
VLGGGLVIPESNEWYVVSNDYAAAEQFFAIADQMWRENNPATACCDNLYKMAAANGVFPRPATTAQGYVRLTGTAGAAVPPEFEVSTSQGTYVSVGTVPMTIPATGTVVVRVQALLPGPDFNSAGTVTEGTLTTPAPNIDDTVIVCGGLFCNGAVAEDCETFRKRYLSRLTYQPHATQAWAKAKLLEFPCATRVCVREGACCKCNAQCSECGCVNCGNRLEFYVLFDDSFSCGIPPQNVVDDINTWFFGEHQGYGEGQVEIGVCGLIHTPIPLLVDVVIDIEGCPTSTQKQVINDLIVALFRRICPSIPLRVKQIELLIASVIGADVNASARFVLVDGENRSAVLVNVCGDLEVECDVLPCLRNITYTGPDSLKPPC